MIDVLNRILHNAKVAYRESIVIDNKLIEDNLLSIISDSKYIIDMLENTQRPKNIKVKSIMSNENRDETEEVKRIHRRIPLWLNRTHQFNYKILVAFMSLSNNNQTSISISLLEKNSDIEDSSIFYSNFNQMKIISPKNHGKVFTEENGSVRLWEPIAEFVINEFNQKIQRNTLIL